MHTQAALHVLWYKLMWKKITGQSPKCFIEQNTTIIKTKSTKHALSGLL